MATLDLILLIAGAGLAITAVFALIRMIIGPTLLDRMISSDLLVTTLLLAMGAEMVYHGHTDTIALMIGLAATSVFATIAVARHVRKRDDAEEVRRA